MLFKHADEKTGGHELTSRYGDNTSSPFLLRFHAEQKKIVLPPAWAILHNTVAFQNQRYSSNGIVRLWIWFDYSTSSIKAEQRHKGRTPPFQRFMVGPRVLQTTSTGSSSLFESVNMEDYIQKSLPYHLSGPWCILNTKVYYLRIMEVLIRPNRNWKRGKVNLVIALDMYHWGFILREP